MRPVPKRSSKRPDRDTNQIAAAIIAQVSGEAPAPSQTEDPFPGRW